MAVTLSLWTGNDNLIILDQLKDESTGSFVNNATVTVESITDSSGNTISGVTFPISMSYVTGSNGKYQGILEETASLTDYTRYTVTIKAVQGASVGLWKVPAVALPRQ